MPEFMKKTARKILDKKEEKSFLDKAKDFIQPDASPNQAIEAKGPFDPIDVLAAIPVAGTAGKAVQGAERVEGLAKKVADVAEYWKKAKVTRTAKPLAERAEQILIKGDKAAPKLEKAREVFGKLSNAAKKAMEARGEYAVMKRK